MKSVLFIAYHFPPILGSSGYLRTLKFIRYLPEFGIEPTILTVNPMAYPSWNEAQLAQIPKGIEVHRTFAWDARRHLGIAGRYPFFLGLPDRYSTWIPSAIWQGLRIMKQKRIDAIFSTYPIPSAHIIGGALAWKTSKPWMADFRDPMWDDDSGPLSLEMKTRKIIEAKTMQRCSHALVCTDGVHSLFKKRYGETAAAKTTVIPNGFDDNDFKDLPKTIRKAGSPVTMIHAGLLQQEDRDPVPFLGAVRIALDRGLVRRGGLLIKLMGTGNNAIYQQEIVNLGLEDIVFLLPPKPYSEALLEVAESDILLLFQGPSCDPQIPAKLYEYMRIGKPILAVTTQNGETGKSVMATKSGKVVTWDDKEALARTLGEWVLGIATGQALPCCEISEAMVFSRRNQAQVLAEKLAGLLG